MDKETRISSASSENVEISEHEKGLDASGETTTAAAAEDGLTLRASSAILPEAPGIPDQSDGSRAHKIPDGGLEAWLQVLGAWVILLDTWGLVNSFGVFQTYYETELLRSSSSSAISWIGSLQGALLMIVGVVSGPLYDAGYFRELIVAGMALIVFGQFMTSLCSQYWQVLLAQGITMGVGMGLSFLPSAAILAQYFDKRRALVLGISSSGSPLAGIVFPILFSRLTASVGFGWATRVIAFVLLGISAVPVAFMHTRADLRAHQQRRRQHRALFDPTALHDGPYLIVIFSLFATFLVLYVAFFYIQLFTQAHGLASPDFSPYLVTMLNVGSVFGRIVPNALADRAGSLNVLVVCAVASAALLFAWLGIHNLAGLVAFALLYGVFSGGIVAVSPSVIMSLTPDLGRVGARLGMSFTLTGTSLLVGTPIAGAILGGFGEQEWLGMIGYAAAGLSVGAMGFVAGRIVLYRKRGGWRS